MFHRPGLPADLPPPDVLWTRLATCAVISSGLGGHGCALIDAALTVDRGDSRLVVARVAGGGFLLLGDDHGSIPARGRRRPNDPFRDAPVWFPWEWLERTGNTAPDLAYWWDGAWARTALPDDWDDDGLGSVVGRWATESGAVTEIAALIPGGAEASAVQEALRALVDRAASRTMDSGPLGDLFAPVSDADSGRALETARLLGLTSEEAVPELAAGSGSSGSLPCPLIGSDEWGLLVGDAMRAAAELPCRSPATGSSALVGQLAAAVRSSVLGDADRCVIVYGPLRCWVLSTEGGGELVRSTGITELLQRLRDEEAHPEHGCWLYARVTVGRRDSQVERAYDHWPEWAADEPWGRVTDLAGLHDEIEARSPEWRPAWADLLDPGVPYAPPWPGPPTTPSVAPARLDAAGRSALLDVIRALVAGAAEGHDWTWLRLSYRSLVGYAGGELTALLPDGKRLLSLPPSLRAQMGALRSATYSESRGAWFSVDLLLEGSSGWRITYDREGEPGFCLPPPAFSYALDARYFPRDRAHTPPWLAERLRAARG